MTLEELHQVFVTSGISCRVQRHEVVLEVCLFCGNDRWNLGCSPDKGVYYCWACKTGGRLAELLRTTTGQTFNIQVVRGEKKQKPAAPIQKVEFQSLPISGVWSAAQYLERRGISAQVAAQYGLVVCTEEKHRLFGRIAIPLRDFWTGEVVGWSGRSYTGKEPKYLSTLTSKVITGWRQREKDVPAVIVEGPMDGLAVHRAGFQVAVLSGIGDAGIVPWAARLPQSTTVLIMLDGSAFDQARQLYWQVWPMRTQPPIIVRLPEDQDPSSLGVENVGILVRHALSTQAHTVQ